MRSLIALLGATGGALAHDLSCPSAAAQHYCFDVTCGVKLAEASIVRNLDCDCTTEHIGYDFTECDQDNKRSIYYFWKPPATCRAGEVTLPRPVHGVDCDINCDMGLYLDASADTPICKDCAAGKYSLGGGMSFDPPWTVLPPQFTTSCVGDHPCNTWRPMSQFLDSGDNYENPNTDNTLTLELELVREGQVSFEYKYDGEENFDVFQFFDNGLQLFESEEVVTQWTEANFTLSKGYHSVEWVFHKDSSLSEGSDKAVIKSIRFSGTRANALECHECPPGRFSSERQATECDPCPANTFSRTYGATECEACKSWEKSFPGSPDCMPSLPCTAFDRAPVLSPCVGGKRNRSYAWIQPKKCESEHATQGSIVDVGRSDTMVKLVPVQFLQPFLEIPTLTEFEAIKPRWAASNDQYNISAIDVTTEGFQLRVKRVNSSDVGWGEDLEVRWVAVSETGEILPEAEEEDCAVPSCKPGQQKISGTHQCENCPSGRAGEGGMKPCNTCGEGKGAADFVQHFESWGEELAAANVFTTGCFGDCGTTGWRTTGTFVDSGAGHGKGAQSSMALRVKRDSSLKSVDLVFLLSCPSDSGFLELAMDNAIIDRVACSGCKTDDDRQTTVVTVPPPDPSLTRPPTSEYAEFSITYHKVMAPQSSHDCDVARVYSVTMHTLTGGNDTAVSAGGATQCATCKPGSFSASADLTCSTCAAGQYAAWEGSSSCEICDIGTITYRPGMAECLECGKKTHASDDQSTCVNGCKPMVQGTEQYMLASLEPSVLTVQSRLTTDFKLSGVLTYHISICQEMGYKDGFPAMCARASEEGWSTVVEEQGGGQDVIVHPGAGNPAYPLHVCMVHKPTGLGANEQIVNGGATVGYLPLDPDRAKANTTSSTVNTGGLYDLGVTISFQHGSKVQCSAADGTTLREPQSLTTLFHLVCTPGVKAEPVDVTPSSTGVKVPPCKSEFEWRTSAACPACTDKDYSFYDDDCDADKSSRRTYFWKEPKACIGGVTLPVPEESYGCEPMEKVEPGHVVVSSVTVTGLAVAGALLLLGIAGGITYVIRKRRILYEENMRLRSYAQLAGDGPVPDVVQLHDK